MRHVQHGSAAFARLQGGVREGELAGRAGNIVQDTLPQGHEPQVFRVQVETLSFVDNENFLFLSEIL